MKRQIVCLATGLIALCVFHGPLVLPLISQERDSTAETPTSIGTIQSVSPGVIVVSDANGKEHTLKIQEKGKDSVPLAGGKARTKLLPKVEVTGSMAAAELEPGMLVRFEAQLDRTGKSHGDVDQLTVFDEKLHSLGIEPQGEPPARGKPATCLVAGEIYTLRQGRLVVTVPMSEFTRKRRIAFDVAENAIVKTHSDDHRRAQPGDEVVRIVTASYSTGDILVKEIVIRLNAKPAANRNDALAAKYRRYSDEPGKPRDVASAHFLLHTDVSDRSAHELLDKLETMIELVAQYYKQPPRGKIECYVVRDVGQWPGLNADGAAKIARREGVTISLQTGRKVHAITVFACEDHGVVQHEAVHAYCSQVFGSTGPTWYSEGIAEMGQYWKKGERAVDVAAVVIDYLKHAEPKKMLDIVAANQITGDSWRAYAWRWALCHLLANNPNYSGRFKGLGIAMMSGQKASFETAYGARAQEISFEYDQFVKHFDNGYRADLCAWQWDKRSVGLFDQRRIKSKILARHGWQATGLQVADGVSYDFVAEGTWQTAKAGQAVGADGLPSGAGRLIGVVFKDFALGKPVELGQRGSFVAAGDGDLYVRCREAWSRLADNDGSVTLHLRRTPK